MSYFLQSYKKFLIEQIFYDFLDYLFVNIKRQTNENFLIKYHFQFFFVMRISNILK